MWLIARKVFNRGGSNPSPKAKKRLDKQNILLYSNGIVRKTQEINMKKFLMATAIIAGIATSASAHAEMRIRVQVTDTEAVYSTKTIQTPRQTCSTVEVPIYGNTGGGASAGDVLGGIIIGGLLGKGASGNDKGAAAGAVIGGMIAADKKKGNQQIIGYRAEQRCSTTYSTEQVDKANGYKVYYTLNGERFHTHSHRYVQPGKWLTLRLKVTSVFANP